MEVKFTWQRWHPVGWACRCLQLLRLQLEKQAQAELVQ